VAADIVNAIKNDLGNDICAYSDRELELALREWPGVKYHVDSYDHIRVYFLRKLSRYSS